MHIVIGGAANGKRKFVQEVVAPGVRWMGEKAPLNLTEVSQLLVEEPAVISHVEQWMATRLGEEQQAIDEFLKAVSGKDVIVIVTDIGRGIVPMDARARVLRDACGRLNQQLVKEAIEVTRIWFGIPQKLK